MGSSSPPESAPTAAPRRRRRRWPWIVLALVIALLVGLRLAAPEGVRRLVEREAEGLLGRAVSVGHVDLALWRGAVVARDVRVGAAALAPAEDAASGEAAGEEPSPGGAGDFLLRVPRVELEIDLLALFDREIHLDSLYLESPHLRLRQLDDESLEPLVLAAEDEAAEEPGTPWAYRLDALGIDDGTAQLAHADEVEPALDLRLGRLSVRDIALGGDVLAIGEIALSEPDLRLRSDLRFAAAEGGEEEGADEGLLDVRVGGITVEQAQLRLLGEPVALDLAVRLSAANLRIRGDETFPVQLRLAPARGGELRIEGEARLANPIFAGTVEAEGLPLPVVIDLAPGLPLDVPEGTLGGALEVRLDAGDGDAPAQLVFAGSVALRDVQASDAASGTTFAWRELALETDETRVPLGGGAPVALDLTRVALVAPDVRLVRSAEAAAGGEAEAAGEGAETAAGAGEDAAAGPGDAPDVAAGPETAGPGEPGQQAPAAGEAEGDGSLTLRAAVLEISEGTLAFVDQGVSPPFEALLREVTANATGVRYPDPLAETLTVRALGPDGATLRIEGEAAGATGAYQLDLDGLALAKLNPYVEQRIGQRIEDGTGTVRTKIDVAPERVAIDGTLVLNALGLTGTESAEFQRRYGISLPVALALLRNRAGDVILTPSLVIEAGEVRYTNVFEQAFEQGIRGALRIPFKTLGLALPWTGGPGVPTEAFEMEPATARLAPEAVSRVRALADVLAEHPELGVTLRGRAGRSDARVLAEALRGEGEAVPAEGVGDARLLRLAWERAQVVRQALLQTEEVDPERVRFDEVELGEPPSVDFTLAAAGGPELQEAALELPPEMRGAQEAAREDLVEEAAPEEPAPGEGEEEEDGGFFDFVPDPRDLLP